MTMFGPVSSKVGTITERFACIIVAEHENESRNVIQEVQHM